MVPPPHFLERIDALDSEDSRQKIWVKIPFLGKQGEFLIKKLIKKLQRNITEPVKFIVIYQTKRISYFLPTKTIKFRICREII